MSCEYYQIKHYLRHLAVGKSKSMYNTTSFATLPGKVIGS